MTKPCNCLAEGPAKDSLREHIGIAQPGYAEIDLWTCKHCGARWLHYFFEHEGFSGSQRAYAGFLGDASAPAPNDAAALLNTLRPRFIWRWKEAHWEPYQGTIRQDL